MKLSFLLVALLAFYACGNQPTPEVTVEADSVETGVISEVAPCCDTLEVDTPAVSADSAL